MFLYQVFLRSVWSIRELFSWAGCCVPVILPWIRAPITTATTTNWATETTVTASTATSTGWDPTTAAATTTTTTTTTTTATVVSEVTKTRANRWSGNLFWKLFEYSSHKRPPKMRRFCDCVRAGGGRLRESNSRWSFPRRGPDTFYSFCGKKIMSRNFKGRICVYT